MCQKRSLEYIPYDARRGSYEMYSSFGWKWKLRLGTWRVTGEMGKGKERYNVNWLSRYFAGGWWVGKFENSVCKVFMLLCIRYRWNCEMIAKGDTNTLFTSNKVHITNMFPCSLSWHIAIILLIES